MKKLLILTILSLSFACDREVKPDPVLPTDSHMCAPACDNLRRLDCSEGEDLIIDGEVVTCEKFCTNTQENGHALNPTCVANITSCGALDTCLFKGKP